MNIDDFYVGYQPHSPPGLRRFLKPWILGGVLGFAGVAGLIALVQDRFEPSQFEFGVRREYTGVAVRHPVAALFRGPDGYLLFGEGKHALRADVPDFQTVRVRGSLIAQGQARGIEVAGRIEPTGVAGQPPRRIDLGRVTLAGEIVDSKCYFGVMNPGRGKVHKDCAVRCISGGIPAALLVRDAAGNARALILSGIPASELKPYVAERVRLSGDLSRMGSLWLLQADAASLHRE